LVDLIDRKISGLAPGRSVRRQIAGQGHDVADLQVELRASSATAAGSQSHRYEKHRGRDCWRTKLCSSQDPLLSEFLALTTFPRHSHIRSGARSLPPAPRS